MHFPLAFSLLHSPLPFRQTSNSFGNTSTRRPWQASRSHALRQRIASVQAAEKLVSALRLVSAARIRASSAAALRARPFAEEVQRMLASLLAEINGRNIDVMGIAKSSSASRLSDIGGDVLADPFVQKSLLDRMYLSLMREGKGPRMERVPGVCILAIITADRGFCGTYNKEVLGKTVRRIDELRKGGRSVELIIVGNTGKSYFQKHYKGLRILCFKELGRSGDADNVATAVSYALLSEFIAGGVERVEIVYTRFVSLMCSMPSARTLLPLTPTGIEAVGDELFELRWTTENGRLKANRMPSGELINGSNIHHLHDQDVETHGYTSVQPQLGNFYNISDEEALLLLNSMLPMYVTSQLIRIIREAIAAEQASRLTAMTAATDNARDIVTDLRSQYNKERQARITTEIIEVVSNTNI